MLRSSNDNLPCPTIILYPESVEKFRTLSELEDSYRAKGARNPLSPKDTLGRFLAAFYKNRSFDRLGGDYLLLTVLTGASKEKTASLC